MVSATSAVGGISQKNFLQRVFLAYVKRARLAEYACQTGDVGTSIL